ncbi:MASE1 domain-containing protein [Streptomyces sp. NBC_01754]|uniref:MASE1 domain-containing protein n=1 Tax=Streptomyces sp. NBC_01754 TaxID=2975930 RepID=UPI002DD961A1|nr:MASE1 domain-containing protein [Streptomyces sp. NBC_01754]WSC96501.1 MASE1 domain-containing protein [Streptomyces sp. NBC_01754]
MIRSQETRHRAVAVLRMLGITAAYYLSGQLGLLRQVSVEGSVVTPLWPPTGISLAALLYLGAGVWPGIALGALLTLVDLSGGLSPSGAGITAASTLAPLCACFALRAVGFHRELDRLRDGVVLVFLGAMGGMLVSATVGAVTLVLNGDLSSHHFWQVWSAWWAGDAMGVLVVTPLLLVLRKARLPRAGDRWVEASGLAVVTVVITVVVTRSPLPMIYLLFPVLIWAALRFQLAGSTPCALLMSVMAIIAGTGRAGPFAGHTVLEVMLNLTVLNACVALTALLLGAIVTEHNNIRRETELACEELAALVEELAPRPDAGDGRTDSTAGPPAPL